MLFNKIIK